MPTTREEYQTLFNQPNLQLARHLREFQNNEIHGKTHVRAYRFKVQICQQHKPAMSTFTGQDIKGKEHTKMRGAALFIHRRAEALAFDRGWEECGVAVAGPSKCNVL